MSTLKKPHPDAIQTVYGWALPATGEVLVSKRGLPDPVSGFKIGRPWKNEVVAPKPIKPDVVSEVIKPEIEVTPEDIESFDDMVAEVPVIKPKRVVRKKVEPKTEDENLA